MYGMYGRLWSRRGLRSLVFIAPAAQLAQHHAGGMPRRTQSDAGYAGGEAAARAVMSQAVAAQGAHDGEWRTALRRSLRWAERRARALWMLLKRSLYLFCVLAPAAATAPALLLGHERLSVAWWAFFRDCIRWSGPCATKFAQWIATRPDLFPLAMCQHLEDLQSKVFYHTWADTEAALARALGPDWSTKVAIDWAPAATVVGGSEGSASSSAKGSERRPVVLGSGCIAQVIRGRALTGDSGGGGGGGGREDAVAIKIVHPGVRDSIDADVAILRQVRRWPAWKCVQHEEAPSYPGTSTLLLLRQVCYQRTTELVRNPC